MDLKNDWQDFVNALTALGEFHERKLSPALVKMYWEAVSGLSREEFDRAVATVMVSSRRFPLPVDLIEAVRGTLDERAGKAFDIIWSQILGNGGGQNVDFGDPLIHHVIESMDGGWDGLCGSLISERPWIRKTFIEKYRMASKLPREQLCREAPVILFGRFGSDCKTVRKLTGFGHEKALTVKLLASEDRKQIEEGPKRLEAVK
jgi:hypothetical protein